MLVPPFRWNSVRKPTEKDSVWTIRVVAMRLGWWKNVFRARLMLLELLADPPSVLIPPACGPSSSNAAASDRPTAFNVNVIAGETV